jgi:hypothetical protein
MARRNTKDKEPDELPFDARDVVALLSGWRGLARMLRQRSLVEGVWNGRRGWLGVAAVVWGGYGLRKAFARSDKVLLREVLKPGQEILISEPIIRPTRRQARKLRKAGNRS